MKILLEPLPPTESSPAQVAASILATARNELNICEILPGLVEGQLNLYKKTGARNPWIGYLARDPLTDEIVGSCSFIGSPSSGSVEIAYFTFPPYEGRGVATAMASELIQISEEAGDPDLHAFTLPETNASTRILQKLRFQIVGEAQDEDVGKVWRWERQ